ncbi:cytochrome P450 [Rhizopogon salebrosus TDB-379]|nr:cytochrome P450 [Rhizopogon salebrosus TDB-379]
MVLQALDGRLAILIVLTASFPIIIVLRRFFAYRVRGPLPPGPVPLPIIGNILSIGKEPWVTYTEWSSIYGDLIFVQILDQAVVVINSQHVAEALMDKRSRIYSDRPYLATLEPFGWSYHFAFAGYNDTWRVCRRLFHQTFRPESALKFRPGQIKRARELIVNMIDDPQHYPSHFATFTSSTAMSAVYGYEPSSRDDPLVQVVETAQEIGITMMTPERAMMVRIFPFLLKLPEWCWGSSIRRDAQASTKHMHEMEELPFQYVQQHMTDSAFLGQPSMVTENLQRIDKQDESLRPMLRTALKNTAATAIAGAYETANVQKCAQAEIDSVVGKYRLPTFEDRTSLPYVDAVLRETLRWNPIAPLGIPHATLCEDIYDGYVIPKGATVAMNIWAMTRDEKRYPDACHFVPERFIDANGALTNDDPKQYVFGLGRRICPGRSTADASVWSAIVTLLATLDISYAKDEQGNVINFTPEFTSGLTRRPTTFSCSISARSHFHSELLDLL